MASITTTATIDTESLNGATPLLPFLLDQHRLLVGDLVLDLALRTISSGTSRSVVLSGNEFVILATLAKTPGRFVSKLDLLVAVTGSETGAHHSVIDTYITYLHRRLQEADSSATVEKLPDVGFRLCP